MEQTECSETSAYKIQASGNYPEENIQPSSLLHHVYEAEQKETSGSHCQMVRHSDSQPASQSVPLGVEPFDQQNLTVNNSVKNAISMHNWY